MNKKILIAGLACLSVVAVAQQAQEKKAPVSKSHEVSSPRDVASGMATGRRTAPAPSTQNTDSKNVIHRDLAAREASSGMATGRVATGDVNGDGSADSAKSSAHATETLSVSESGSAPAPKNAVATPRDSASGLATGKRMHKPMMVTTPEEQSNSQAEKTPKK